MRSRTAPEELDFDSLSFRQALGRFATGVAVVTTLGYGGRRVGVTVNSFSSVSLDPPLILWSLALQAPSFPAFRDAGRFAVSILAAEQEPLARQFARSGTDKFDGVALEAGEAGLPLIAGSAAHLECRTETKYPGGDHAIFIGRVERHAAFRRTPLVFCNGAFHRSPAALPEA